MSIDYDAPDYWSRQGADYTGDDCKNCARQRVLLYAEAGRRVCEKCNWDQDRGDYAYDHHERNI